MIENSNYSIIKILSEARCFYGNSADETFPSLQEAQLHEIASRHFLLLENSHTPKPIFPLQSDANACYTGQIPTNSDEIIFSQFLVKKKMDRFITTWIDSILNRSFMKMCNTTRKMITCHIKKDKTALACILFSPKTGLLYIIGHMMHVDLLLKTRKFSLLTPRILSDDTIYTLFYRSPPHIDSFTILMRDPSQPLSVRALQQRNCSIRKIEIRKKNPENPEKFWVYNIESYSVENSTIIHYEERPGMGFLFGMFDGKGTDGPAMEICDLFAKNFFSNYFSRIDQKGFTNFSLHCQTHLAKKFSAGFATVSYLFSHDDGTIDLASSGHESIYLVYRNDSKWSITTLVNGTDPEIIHNFKKRERIEKAVPRALGHINAQRAPLFCRTKHPQGWSFLIISSQHSNCTPLRLHIALKKMESTKEGELVDRLTELCKQEGTITVTSKKKFFQIA